MITCKKFYVGKMGSLFCTARILLYCWDEIFSYNCFSPPRQDEKFNKQISLRISIKVHFNRPKISLLCFYDAYDTNLWEKMFIILQKQSPEAFLKTDILKDFAIFTAKHLCRSLIAWIQVGNFIKKRPQHWCFPVNTVKFLVTLILKKICEQLLLILWKRISNSTKQLNNSSKKLLNQCKSMGFKFCKLTLLCRGYIGKFTPHFLWFLFY